MGTRGIYGIQKNNEQKLMYNHFDSYPEGLGMTVLHFISNHKIQNIELMFDNIIPVQPGQKPTQEQIDLFKEANVLNLSVSTRKEDDWYCLTRELQGNPEALLELTKKSKVPLEINNNFINDSLFCEYGYVMNLDDGTLDYYIGFQKDGDGYGPCKLAKKYKFNDITPSSLNAIVSEMEKLSE